MGFLPVQRNVSKRASRPKDSGMSSPSAAARQRYHPALIYSFQQGVLSVETLRAIPPSTRSDWRQRDLSRMIGFDPEDPFLRSTDLTRKILQRETLQAAVAALVRVSDFYITTLESLRGVKRVWKKRRAAIVQLIAEITPAVGLAEACRLLRLKPNGFYYWKRAVDCPAHPAALCGKEHPGRLTLAECQTIESVLQKPETKHWPLVHRYLQMLREGRAFVGLSAFYEQAAALRIKQERPVKAPRRKGIRASRPLELLHVDVTVLRLHNKLRIFIQFIQDNYSRAILGWRASLSPWKSADTRAHLEEVCKTHDLFNKPARLLCDGGSENAGEVDLFLAGANISIQRIVAWVDVWFSNSMIEAVNKRIKYEFLFRILRHLHSLGDVERAIAAAVAEYNARPLGVLFGSTPVEVLAGEIPDKDRFKPQILAAKLARPVINRAQLCGKC